MAPGGRRLGGSGLGVNTLRKCTIGRWSFPSGGPSPLPAKYTHVHPLLSPHEPHSLWENGNDGAYLAGDCKDLMGDTEGQIRAPILEQLRATRIIFPQKFTNSSVCNEIACKT